MQISFIADSPEQTANIAAAIGRVLGAGDVLLLEGPIGAGKTHFARSLIQDRMQAEGAIEDVPSPTFTLVQCYPFQDAEIWHADLYRLTDPNEVIELGLEEAFETAICLVEWPDRLADLVPPKALTLQLETITETSRSMTLSSADPSWAARLQDLTSAAA